MAAASSTPAPAEPRPSLEDDGMARVRAVPAYRLLVVRATKGLRELGVLLGREYKPSILAGRQRWLDYYLTQEKSTTEEQLKEFTELATTAIRQCCPHAAQFLDGLSEATELDMYSSMLDFELETWDHIVTLRKKQEKAILKAKGVISALNITANGHHADGTPPAPGDSAATVPDAEEQEEPKGHCTGLCLASTSSPSSSSPNEKFALVAQTVELPLKLYGQGDIDVVLHLEWPHAGSTARVLCYDSDARCCPVGFNSAGLAIGIFTMKQKQEVGFMRPSVSIQALLWELLLGQYSLAAALDYLRALPCGCMCGAALLLADPTGSVNVELNPDGAHFEPPAPDRLIRRANHPMLPHPIESTSNNKADQKYSEERLKHLDDLLKAHAKQKRKDKKEKKEKKEKPEPLEKLKVGPAQALAALCSSDLICNTRALAVVVSDVVAGRLFCLFKERWTTTGTQKHRLVTCKQQAHKVRRRLYLYAIEDISATENEEDMEQDKEGSGDDDEDEETEGATSSTGGEADSDDDEDSAEPTDGEEEEEDEEEEAEDEAAAEGEGAAPAKETGAAAESAAPTEEDGHRHGHRKQAGHHHSSHHHHGSHHHHHCSHRHQHHAPKEAESPTSGETPVPGPKPPEAKPATSLVPRKRKPSQT